MTYEEAIEWLRNNFGDESNAVITTDGTGTTLDPLWDHQEQVKVQTCSATCSGNSVPNEVLDAIRQNFSALSSNYTINFKVQLAYNKKQNHFHKGKKVNTGSTTKTTRSHATGEANNTQRSMHLETPLYLNDPETIVGKWYLASNSRDSAMEVLQTTGVNAGIQKDPLVLTNTNRRYWMSHSSHTLKNSRGLGGSNMSLVNGGGPNKNPIVLPYYTTGTPVTATDLKNVRNAKVYISGNSYNVGEYIKRSLNNAGLYGTYYRVDRAIDGSQTLDYYIEHYYVRAICSDLQRKSYSAFEVCYGKGGFYRFNVAMTPSSISGNAIKDNVTLIGNFGVSCEDRLYEEARFKVGAAKHNTRDTYQTDVQKIYYQPESEPDLKNCYTFSNSSLGISAGSYTFNNLEDIAKYQALKRTNKHRDNDYYSFRFKWAPVLVATLHLKNHVKTDESQTYDDRNVVLIFGAPRFIDIEGTIGALKTGKATAAADRYGTYYTLAQQGTASNSYEGCLYWNKSLPSANDIVVYERGGDSTFYSKSPIILDTLSLSGNVLKITTTNGEDELIIGFRTNQF